MRLPCGRFIVGTSLLALVSTAALAEDCSSPVYKSAFSVRSLQTELMVAALTCQAKTDYNAFVTKFKKILVRNGKVLRNYYTLEFGSESEQYLNAYVTRLANKTSQRSIDERDSYCDQSRELFAEILATPPDLLEQAATARPVAETNLPRSCRGTVTVATTG